MGGIGGGARGQGEPDDGGGHEGGEEGDGKEEEEGGVAEPRGVVPRAPRGGRPEGERTARGVQLGS